MSGTSGRWVALAAGCLVALAGCAASRSIPPAPQDEREDRELKAAVGELELRKAELARLDRLSSCGDVCRLSELICQAEGRICEIARRHEGEPGYAQRCAAAGQDCRGSRVECSDCR
jgi:hypothetical protein